MKNRFKRSLSLLLAVVTVVSSIYISDGNVKAEAVSEIPADVTFQTVADITGLETTTVESGVTTALGQVADTAAGFTFDVNRTNGTGILEIGLYNTASGDLSAGGCKLQLHHGDAANVYCWLKRDEWAPKSVAVAEDTMTIHVWNKENTVYLAVNEKLVQTYDISSYGAGTYINVYNGWQSTSAVFTGTFSQDIPTDVTFQTVADITGLETTTVESGVTTELGQVADTATGFTFDVNRTTGSGILEIGLYNTVSGDLSAGGCKLQLHYADATNVYCWLKRDEWAPKSVAVTDDTMTVHVWNKNNTVHLAVNGELVQVYDISAYGAGTYINVYNGWQSDSAVFTAEMSEGNAPNVIYAGVMQSHSNSHAAYGIYFAMDANDAPYSGWSYEYTQTSVDNIKLIRDGETKSIGIVDRPLIVKYGETDYYLKLEGWNVGEYGLNGQSNPITTDDILIIEGDFKYGDVTLNITKSYVYYNGSAWVCSATEPTEPEPSEPTEPTEPSEPSEPSEPTEPNVIDAGLMQSHSNSHAACGIYFAMDANDAPYSGWSYEYTQTSVDNIKLIRDGETISIGIVDRPLIVKYGETDYYLKLEGWNVGEYGLNGQSNPITTDDILIIEGDFKYGDVTLNITKSYVYYNGSAWVCSATEPTEPPAPPVSEEISAGHLSNHSNGLSGEGVYAIMAENAAPYNGWSIEYSPVAAESYYVIRDGKIIPIGMPGRGTLIKYSDTEYFLRINAWCTNNFAFTTDDIIVVEGSWKQNTGGNAILKIDRTFLFYDGAVWTFSTAFPFETVADTTGNLTTTVAANSSSALGRLSGISRGFTFDVNKPTADGTLKIGLYNTAENDVLKDGYMLLVEKAGEANKLQFQLLGSGGADLGQKAEVQVESDTVTVHALCIDGTMYIVVGEQIILTATGSDTMGTHINAVNEWSEDAVFTGIYTQAPKLPEFPTHITFEDIGVTLTENTLPMKSHGTVNFGEASDLEKGFQLKVTVPETTTKGNVKIGFFNTQVANPWTNGYLVFVSATQQEGTVKVSLNTANEQGERSLTMPVEVSGLEDYITISLWMEKGRVYLAAQDKVIAGWTDDGSIKLGLYMSAYSEWEQEGEYRSVNEIEIPPYVDTSVYVNFEDLADTMLKEVMPCSTAQTANFGEVSNTWTGFSLIMNTLNPYQTDMPVKLGFYNTGESNPWMDGYLVAVQIQEDGKYTFTLYKGRDQVLIKSISDVEISKKYLRFDTWLTDGNTFHLKVNGEEVLTHIDKKKEVAVGPYMAAYNDRKETMIFKTINPIVDTSKDVKFMDLGQTLGLNSIPVTPKIPVGLGRLNSSKNGFEFIISMPPASDDGKNVKIGIYNMEKKNPWTGGYLFILSPRANGDMGISLRTGTPSGEILLAYPDDLKGLTGDHLTVRAWISDVNGISHIFHVSVNGTEVIRYKNTDGTVKLGTYLSIYQEGATTLEFKTIYEIVEPAELYLQRYGDPTAMREGNAPEVNKPADQPAEQPTEPMKKPEPQNDFLPFIIGGAALALLAAVIVAIFLVKRKKKK